MSDWRVLTSLRPHQGYLSLSTAAMRVHQPLLSPPPNTSSPSPTISSNTESIKPYRLVSIVRLHEDIPLNKYSSFWEQPRDLLIQAVEL